MAAKLLQNIGQNYEQDRLSLKFKDENLESAFQKDLHPTIVSLSTLPMIVLLCMCISLFLFLLFECINTGIFSAKFIRVISFLILSLSVTIAHYILSRKLMYLALYFAPVQNIFFFVCTVEISIITTPLAETMDGFSAVSALLASLSMLGYN